MITEAICKTDNKAAARGVLELERKQHHEKKFVRYKEGAELYSMSQSKFERLAKDANATYKIDKIVLINCDIFERYLENFRVLEEVEH